MSRFFAAKRVESLVLIDIGPDSIGGAVAVLGEDAPPLILSTSRLPIERHEGELSITALERSLTALLAIVLRQGMPALEHERGSGRVDCIVLALSPPWQESRASIEVLASKEAESFTFTHAMLAETLRRAGERVAGETLADEIVVGILLNGYETRAPFGKRAHQASVYLLSSTIATPLAEILGAALRHTFHSERRVVAASAGVLYRALRALFPHEVEYLICEARGGLLSLHLIKRGLLTASDTFALGTDLAA